MSKAPTQAASVTVRRAFFTLLGEVHDELSKDAIAKTVAVDPAFAKDVTKAVSVLRGVSADIQILARIVRANLPAYRFPKLVEPFIS